MLLSHRTALAARAHAARRRMPIGRLLKGILALFRLVLTMTLMLLALLVLNLASRVGVRYRQQRDRLRRRRRSADRPIGL